jgi:hypothetical protein
MRTFRAPPNRVTVLIPIAFGFTPRPNAAPSQRANSKSAVTAGVVAAANAFLATLSDAERSKGIFGFTGSQRTGWSNLPSGIFSGTVCASRYDRAAAAGRAGRRRVGPEPTEAPHRSTRIALTSICRRRV